MLAWRRSSEHPFCYVKNGLQGQTICYTIAVFGLSRSALYREFEPFGGVAKYVAQARLLRCHQMLTSADPDQIRVLDIAHIWNFGEPSIFSRSFRRQFGVPPSRDKAEAEMFFLVAS